jgi:hypothetical protein
MLLWSRAAKPEITFRPRGSSPPRRFTPATASGVLQPVTAMGFVAFLASRSAAGKPTSDREDLPRNTVRTPRRIPFAGSRTASLRPLPSCRYDCTPHSQARLRAHRPSRRSDSITVPGRTPISHPARRVMCAVASRPKPQRRPRPPGLTGRSRPSHDEHAEPFRKRGTTEAVNPPNSAEAHTGRSPRESYCYPRTRPLLQADDPVRRVSLTSPPRGAPSGTEAPGRSFAPKCVRGKEHAEDSTPVRRPAGRRHRSDANPAMIRQANHRCTSTSR